MIRPGTRLSRGVSHACASHLVCVCGSTRMFGWGCEIRVCARLCVRLAPWHVGTGRCAVTGVGLVSVRGAVRPDRSSA